MMQFVRTYRVAIVLGLLVIVVIGPVVQPDNSQPASRFALTAALVEHHSVDLGPYKGELGIDFSKYRGRLRSDKAPGQPIFAAPLYAVARAVGAESASHRRVHENLTLWWIELWSATLPLAILIGLIYLECCRFASPRTALAVALLMVFTTMLLVFGAVLFGHDLAALCCFAAWMLVNREAVTPRRVALAGLLAGCAVLVEYETFIVAAIIGGHVLVRHRSRIAPYLLGAVPPALLLAFYQWRAFGAPWRTPAGFYNPNSGYNNVGAGYSIPSAHDLWLIFGGSRGLWVGAPIAIVGIAAAMWLAATGGGAARDAAVVALAIALPYIVLSAGWSGTPLLVDPGPRYLIPALPFLAVPLAVMWRRVRIVAIPVAVYGALIAWGAVWVLAVIRYRYTNLLAVYRYYIQQHRFTPTVWTIAFGTLGDIPYAVLIVAVIALLVCVSRDRTDVRSPVPEPLR